MYKIRSSMAIILLLTNNAAKEVLLNPQYAGAMETIQKVTGVIDSGFAMFITFTAFFIIMSGLAKNVVAGAYVAWPDLWDKVDECHKQYTLNKNLFSRDSANNWLSGQMGSNGPQGGHSTVAMAIYTILPNFKAMTPWASNDGGEAPPGVSAKEYFFKAIPQLVAIVFIGVFIYNGYYRDVTIKATDFGSEAFTRIINKADPMALVDKALGTLNKPEFESSLGKDQRSKVTNALANEIYAATVAVYSDIKNADVERALASEIERIIIDKLTTAESNISGALGDVAGDIWDEERYSIKFQVNRVAGESEAGIIEGNNTTADKIRVRKNGVDQLYQYFTITNLFSTFNLADKTLQEPDRAYSINVAIVWNRKLERAESNSSRTVTLTITKPSGNISKKTTLVDSVVAVSFGGIPMTYTVGTEVVLLMTDNTTKRATVVESSTTPKTEIKLMSATEVQIDWNLVTKIQSVGAGIKWVPGDGKEHKIREVIFGSSFLAADGEYKSTSPTTSPALPDKEPKVEGETE